MMKKFKKEIGFLLAMGGFILGVALSSLSPQRDIDAVKRIRNISANYAHNVYEVTMVDGEVYTWYID